MKRAILTAFALMAFTMAANAATINFDSTATGDYTSLVFADLTITYTGGSGGFSVVSASPGAPISGNALNNSMRFGYDASPFRVTFNDNTNVTAFSIGVGDYNADVDNDFLRAYDAFGNLLASDDYQNPAAKYGGDFMSVASSTAIKYVEFWDAEPFPGAVYWDELSYTTSDTQPVPEPSTIALLGLGLAGIVVARRRVRQ